MVCTVRINQSLMDVASFTMEFNKKANNKSINLKRSLILIDYCRELGATTLMWDGGGDDETVAELSAVGESASSLFLSSLLSLSRSQIRIELSASWRISAVWMQERRCGWRGHESVPPLEEGVRLRRLLGLVGVLELRKEAWRLGILGDEVRLGRRDRLDRLCWGERISVVVSRSLTNWEDDLRGASFVSSW